MINPRSEYRNPKQFRNCKSKIQNLSNLVLRACDLLRSLKTDSSLELRFYTGRKEPLCE